MQSRSARYLLPIIYLGFLSLGLPDGTLGVAWPQLHTTLGLPIGLAGPLLLWVTLLAAGSSFASGAVGRRWTVGPVVMVSCLMTAVGILLISQAQGLVWLVVAAVPLGLGAGAVDAGLNAYVAKHYEARHMNWLHAFWGVGATSGPLVVASCLGGVEGWRLGYIIIGSIQLSLAGLFALTLKLWPTVPERKAANFSNSGGSENEVMGTREPTMSANSEAGWWSAVIFALYVGVETTAGLWIASNLVETRGASLAAAGYLATAYYGSIALMRVLSGFVVDRWGNRRVVTGGAVLAVAGAGLYCLPGPLWMAGLAVVALGCGFAPIYPGLMHEVPRRFAPDAVQLVIGRQTGGAYVGGAALPALSGWVVQTLTVASMPWFVLGGVVIMALVIRRVDRLT